MPNQRIDARASSIRSREIGIDPNKRGLLKRGLRRVTTPDPVVSLLTQAVTASGIALGVTELVAEVAELSDKIQISQRSRLKIAAALASANLLEACGTSPNVTTESNGDQIVHWEIPTIDGSYNYWNVPASGFRKLSDKPVTQIYYNSENATFPKEVVPADLWQITLQNVNVHHKSIDSNTNPNYNNPADPAAIDTFVNGVTMQVWVDRTKDGFANLDTLLKENSNTPLEITLKEFPTDSSATSPATGIIFLSAAIPGAQDPYNWVGSNG